MTATEPLTATQRAVLLATFARHADVIERVDLYGSRAAGRHRPGSDVDLMLAGEIDGGRLARIAGDVEESDLSILADVGAYALLEPGRFAERVVATAVPLFTREALLARA